MTEKNHPSFEFLRNFFDEGEFTIKGIRRSFEEEEFYIRSDDLVWEVLGHPDHDPYPEVKYIRFPEYLEEYLKKRVKIFLETIEIRRKFVEVSFCSLLISFSFFLSFEIVNLIK